MIQKVYLLEKNGKTPSSFPFQDDVLALKAFSAMESGAGMERYDVTTDETVRLEVEILGDYCYLCGHAIGLTHEEGLLLITDLGEVVCCHTENEEVCGNTVGIVTKEL